MLKTLFPNKLPKLIVYGQATTKRQKIRWDAVPAVPEVSVSDEKKASTEEGEDVKQRNAEDETNKDEKKKKEKKEKKNGEKKGKKASVVGPVTVVLEFDHVHCSNNRNYYQLEIETEQVKVVKEAMFVLSLSRMRCHESSHSFTNSPCYAPSETFMFNHSVIFRPSSLTKHQMIRDAVQSETLKKYMQPAPSSAYSSKDRCMIIIAAILLILSLFLLFAAYYISQHHITYKRIKVFTSNLATTTHEKFEQFLARFH